MYIDNIYRAGFCLTCQICERGSLQEIGEFLAGLGDYLYQMEEAGIAISDHELLRDGKLAFETDDPEAAKLLEVFKGPVDAEEFADAHQVQ